MFGSLESFCASSCSMCFQRYYQRQPVLVEMGWALYDVMAHINHGMGFCPLAASYLFLLAAMNVCFPQLLRGVKNLSIRNSVKSLILASLPFLGFSVFWRPLNFLILFLVGGSSGCGEMSLGILSYLCAITMFMLSLLFTKRMTQDTKPAHQTGKGSFLSHSAASADSLPADGGDIVHGGSMRKLRHSHEFRKTRSGRVYGFW